jgi:uncharacterized protein
VSAHGPKERHIPTAATLIDGKAQASGSVRLAVRLTPKSSAARILGATDDGHGGWALKVAVTAPPVDGKANAALVRFLAHELGLAPRNLRVVRGATDRHKLIEISGDPVLLKHLIEGLARD